MSTFHARCTEHKARNGRHYCEFVVESPGERPEEFSLQPSPLEYEELKEHSVDADDGAKIGWVPVVDDEGWTVDWDALEAYTR
jgi:hypothetical protein